MINKKIFIFAKDFKAFKECKVENNLDSEIDNIIFIKSKLDFLGMKPQTDRILFYGDWSNNLKYKNKGFQGRLAWLLMQGKAGPIGVV